MSYELYEWLRCGITLWYCVVVMTGGGDDTTWWWHVVVMKPLGYGGDQGLYTDTWWWRSRMVMTGNVMHYEVFVVMVVMTRGGGDDNKWWWWSRLGMVVTRDASRIGWDPGLSPARVGVLGYRQVTGCHCFIQAPLIHWKKNNRTKKVISLQLLLHLFIINMKSYILYIVY